jgi:hypothetical protein
MTLTEIDQLTKRFADAHSHLSGLVGELNAAIEQLKRDAAPALKKAVIVAAERQDHLETAIDGNRDLFANPKTLVFHGIKVGLRKQKGGLEWDKDETVVARLKKLFGEDDAEKYLNIKETPDRAALQKLTVCDLGKIGVQLIADSDEVFIKGADSDIDKIVTALLKAASEPE